MRDEFFRYAIERHRIYMRRQACVPKPWTDDPVLQTSRFTNVYRELDRTTVWFRENVRDRLRMEVEVLLATVVFRWFNRTTTGEALFLQRDVEGESAFALFLDRGEPGILRDAILRYCGSGPYVTGAYTINTISAPRGLSKLDLTDLPFGHKAAQVHLTQIDQGDQWSAGRNHFPRFGCPCRHDTIERRNNDQILPVRLGFV